MKKKIIYSLPSSYVPELIKLKFKNKYLKINDFFSDEDGVLLVLKHFKKLMELEPEPEKKNPEPVKNRPAPQHWSQCRFLT